MNPAFMKIIRRARSEVNRGKVIPLEQLKQELLAEAGAANERMQPPRGKRRAGAPAAERQVELNRWRGRSK